MLKTEWDFFRANLSDWAKQHPGRYVLVKEHERVGVFSSFHEAVVAGYERLGNNPFLVRLLDPSAEGMPGEAQPKESHGPDHG
jgi:hypothetical protein